MTESAVVGTLRDRGVVLFGCFSFLFSVLSQRIGLHKYESTIANVRTEDDTTLTAGFFPNFMQVAKLALPTIWCKEFIGTTVFILLFLVKSILRVILSKANGNLLNAMLRGSREERIHGFFNALMLRTALTLMSAVSSGSVEHLRSWLIGCYRVRLSRYFQRRFFSNLVYYQATVLDNRLSAADTVIATYCGEFAEHFAELPYYFILPFFECSTSLIALTKEVGGRVSALACGAVVISVLLLQKLSPAFGRIHASLLAKEDNYRRVLTNDLINVESIAMHGGGVYTRRKVDAQLNQVKRSLDFVALAKGDFDLLEVAFSGLLQTLSSIVVFYGSLQNAKKSLNDIYVELQYLQDLNDSVKSFVINFREVSHLATFTTKLAEFDTTLDSIAKGTFIRSMGNLPVIDSNAASPSRYTHINYITHPEGATHFTLFGFSSLTLATPSGQVLLSDFNLTMESDQDWVIVGENGTGKTSLLRMISGLWLPAQGIYSMEKSVKLLFAPQHSYMVPQCTLFEQLLFPQVPKTITEEDIEYFREAITLAGAQSVIDLLGGMESPCVGVDLKNTDDTYDWSSLSGGQKQRISMARVFYHVLKMRHSQVIPVAILDEATSMMDETEEEVLLNLRRLGVRMLSVTHRDNVIAHHTHVLKILPRGKWSFEPVTSRTPVETKVEEV
ncbi:ABC transporter [Trypanosoma theileri]|uniref:ABC transporter n=1 Tax=Trypanosoma theileri TaxID=67003 RepID=A0A1X0P474_9TRYP|nr:ABC transporter [Trypanosoma theileri]ORC91628.1 ABC transporter [Trypanosoma theileri]